MAALRAWHTGFSAREADSQYLDHDSATGQSSRATLGAIRRQLAAYASNRSCDDLADLLQHPAAERDQHARAIMDAIETLRRLPPSTPPS